MLTAEKLRAIRNLRGISQSSLSGLSGISAVSICTFESGKTDMRASNIVKLCTALGVTITYRIDDTEITGP